MNRRHFLMSSIAATTAVAPSIARSSPLDSTDAPAAGGPGVAVLLVDTDRVMASIDERIYGHFLEHINHSVVDGLFAEQIRGCGFEGEDFATYWKSFSDRGSVEIADVEFKNGKKSVRLHVDGGRAGIRQDRLYVAAGYEYDGSVWVKREEGSPHLTLRVVSSRGGPIASVPLALTGSDCKWKDGIGPHVSRRYHPNMIRGGYSDYYDFGTEEFLGLCRKLNTEPPIVLAASSAGSEQVQSLTISEYFSGVRPRFMGSLSIWK